MKALRFLASHFAWLRQGLRGRPSHAHALATIALTVGSVLVGAFAFNALVDPLHMLRPASPSAPVGFYAGERFAMAGLARTQEAEILLVGQSHAQPFSPAQAATLFGGRSLKLTMMGGTAWELGQAVEIALKRGVARRVIWEVNPDILRPPANRRHAQAEFPDLLYSPDHIAVPAYLLSMRTALIGLTMLAGHQQKSLEEYNDWTRDMAFADGAEKQRWCAGGRTKPSPDAMGQAATDYTVIAARIANIEANYLPLVERFPGTHFDLFLTPYSALAYSPATVETEIAFKAWLYQTANRHSNLSLHDFQQAPMVLDMDRYKDQTHFDKAGNAFILDSISAGRFDSSTLDIAKQSNALRAIAAWMPNCGGSPDVTEF